jgi:hypothetical protein
MRLVKTQTQKRDDAILKLVGAQLTKPSLVLSQDEKQTLVKAIRICEQAHELCSSEDYHAAELALRQAIGFWE